MCNQHLLGEHVELHMMVGAIRKNKNLAGYLENNLMEPDSIESRHTELVTEMTKRGMKHKSPLSFTNDFLPTVKVDTSASLNDLLERCTECRGNFYTK
jgi:hypothetical protein